MKIRALGKLLPQKIPPGCFPHPRNSPSWKIPPQGKFLLSQISPRKIFPRKNFPSEKVPLENSLPENFTLHKPYSTTELQQSFNLVTRER